MQTLSKSLTVKILGIGLLAGLAGIAAWVLLAIPPVLQDEKYHRFSDCSVLFGVPNFWNVASNAGFLIAALFGLRALRAREAFLYEWERTAFGILVFGVTLTAFGSGYYHLNPTTQTLFWDRFPMTVVFMSILATIVGERVSTEAGKRLLIPLLLNGALSVLYWRTSGDLRWYGLVQFLPMIAIPAMLLLFPPSYSNTTGTWAMLGLYAVAKAAELFDHQIARIIPAGGHPWKHVAGAAAIICYAVGVRHRKLYREGKGTDGPVGMDSVRERRRNASPIRSSPKISR